MVKVGLKMDGLKLPNMKNQIHPMVTTQITVQLNLSDLEVYQIPTKLSSLDL